jgi:hypothetical protein
MGVLYGILGLAVIIGLAILWGKLKSAASKAANQKILYKTEYKEGKQIVSEPIIFMTSASVSEIMHELDTHVSTVDVTELPVGFKAAVYKSSSSANRIGYAFGNKLYPQTFEAEAVFAAQDAQTIKCIFRILRWNERDGLIMGQEAMKNLRKQVQDAFTAANANKILKGGS